MTVYTADNPPVSEPDRQYYYIEECKKIINEKSKALGRKMTCGIITFGCPIV